jgi:hypothetical protein
VKVLLYIEYHFYYITEGKECQEKTRGDRVEKKSPPCDNLHREGGTKWVLRPTDGHFGGDGRSHHAQGPEKLGSVEVGLFGAYGIPHSIVGDGGLVAAFVEITAKGVALAEG